MDVPIEFPIAAFCESQRLVQRIESWADLTRSSSVALAKGFFRDLSIVDSACASFEVKDATPMNGGAIQSIVRRIFNLTLSVKLDIRPQGKISLDELKVRLCSAIDQDPALWSAVTGRHEDIKERIRKAPTAAAAIAELR